MDLDKRVLELLDAVKNNDTQKIRKLIKNNGYLLSYVYPQEDKTILLIACSEDGVEAYTVRTLLNLKANPQDFTHDDGWEALHWAAVKTKYDILYNLLEKNPEIINSTDNDENNALHLLIGYGNKKSIVFQKCIELLVEKGINVEQKNIMNESSMDWAITNGINNEIMEIMKMPPPTPQTKIFFLREYMTEAVSCSEVLDEDMPPASSDEEGDIGDENNYTKSSSKAVSYVVSKESDQEETLKNNSKPKASDSQDSDEDMSPVSFDEERDIGDKNNFSYCSYSSTAVKGNDIQELEEGNVLFDYLKQGSIDEFINFKDGDIGDLVNYTKAGNTLLQICCRKNLTNAAIHLLNKGANHEKTSPKNNKTPIVIAAEEANYEIFKALLGKYSKITEIPKELLLVILLLQDNNKEDRNNIGCYKIFIEKMKEAEPDDLYFKINEGDEDGNTALHHALACANVNVVEELLNLGASLGSTNKHGIMPINTIEPETLSKHLDNCMVFDLGKRKGDLKWYGITFNYITLIPPYLQQANCNKDVEGLNINSIKEKLVPETEVIHFMSKTSKYKKLLNHPTIMSFLQIKWQRIQWLFFINLVFYIFFAASLLAYIFVEYVNVFSEKPLYHKTIPFLFIFVIIGWFGLLFRELFQIFVDPKKYFVSIENYIEIALLIFTGMIVFVPLNDDIKIQLSSLSTLIIPFELILILGQHPKFSTNVLMFRTVSWNFYKFLIWYSMPIIAFAISFHLLFSTNTENKTFNSAAQSIFQTMIMVTGEFDSGNINFDTFPLVSKLIFTLFIFTIAIILLNLLNGLAVSDTRLIKNEAELIGHISRTQFIRDIERVLTADIFNIYNMYSLTQKLIKIACFFPKCFYHKVKFYSMNDRLVSNSTDNFPEIYLEQDIVIKTNEMFQVKRDEEKKKKEDYNSIQIKRQMELLESKLENILEITNRSKE